MSGKASIDLMEKLHGLTAQKLIDLLDSDDVSSATLAVACRFLKDNGIEADLDQNPAMKALADKLDNLQLPDEGEEPYYTQ